MAAVSSYLTFPSVGWWMQVLKEDIVLLDAAEHFQKMSYRNRYRISGANNSILLSIPLVGGREQAAPVRDVRILNEQHWQLQHWRSIVSVYNRSPYFAHYEPGLRPLFVTRYEWLKDFNYDAIIWVMKQLKIKLNIQEATEYLREYAAGITDLRGKKAAITHFSRYYQVFEDRTGFLPDLSILDLLFSEGPHAGAFLCG